MIPEPISFTGKLSEQEYLDMQHYFFRCHLRLRFRILMGVFSIAIGSVAIIAGIKGGFEPMLVFTLGLCLYFPWIMLFCRPMSARRTYRKNLGNFVEHTVTFTENDVNVSAEYGSTRLNWDRLAYLADTPRGLLFVIAPGHPWIWLPERLFHGNTFKETLLAHAAERKVPIRKLR